MQRRFRLRRGEDFERLRRDGRAYHHRMMTLSVATNGLPHNRYGLITGKRLGNAVTRNRVRRLLREAVRKLHPELRVGYDVVVIARQSIVGQHLDAVTLAARSLLKQAGIFGNGVEGTPSASPDVPIPKDTTD